MPTNSFHSEWIVIRAKNEHRILLSCRAGFPGNDEHFIARVSAELIDRNSSGDARVLKVYHDDKSCTHNVTIASTQKKDEGLVNSLAHVLHEIFGHGNPQAEFIYVAPGDHNSDHYNHMEHLSVGAEIATDRWQHNL
jgi:hypothetical protein